MHPLVQDYLNKKQPEKGRLLLKLGLYEKEYVDDDGFTFGLDYDSEAGKYFKKVPIQISDEEYCQILKYEEQEKQQRNSLYFEESNKISIIFKVIAWIVFVGGFIAGIVLGRDMYDDVSVLMLVYWVAAFVAGMTYYGIAEIIQLLTDIKCK